MSALVSRSSQLSGIERLARWLPKVAWAILALGVAQAIGYTIFVARMGHVGLSQILMSLLGSMGHPLAWFAGLMVLSALLKLFLEVEAQAESPQEEEAREP